MLAGLLGIALLAGLAVAGEPTLALPPGEDRPAWEEALELADLSYADRGTYADLRCRVAAGGWDVVVGEGQAAHVLAHVSAPTSQREREELALLAASFMIELGIRPAGPEVGQPVHPAWPSSSAASDPTPTPGEAAVAVIEYAPSARPASEPPQEPPPHRAPAVPRASEPAVPAVADESPTSPPAEPTGSPSSEDPAEAADLDPAFPEAPPAAEPAVPPAEPTEPGEADTPEAAEASPTAEVPPGPAPPAAWGPVWLSVDVGLQVQESVQAGARSQVGVGLLARQRWWLGLRAGLTSRRTLAAMQDEEWVSERSLGGVVRWSPVRRRVGPSLGVALDNAWRTFSRGAESPAQHSVLVASVEPGLALHGEAWSLLVELRLHEDLDRTVLHQGQDEVAELPRGQAGLGVTIAWRAKKN